MVVGWIVVAMIVVEWIVVMRIVVVWIVVAMIAVAAVVVECNQTPVHMADMYAGIQMAEV
ncbi:hypothetical protein TSUD_92580 [Trifolium subterraneum]|uniref:Uncharacterized protein n=1 Tax=Trifolium subterraneum TaxID=3900 RepID=A0A2Z6NWY2_TRISU|nr:hypothetical protein TSUD_92580 [Trifolium subterraneum]